MTCASLLSASWMLSACDSSSDAIRLGSAWRKVCSISVWADHLPKMQVEDMLRVYSSPCAASGADQSACESTYEYVRLFDCTLS